MRLQVKVTFYQLLRFAWHEQCWKILCGQYHFVRCEKKNLDMMLPLTILVIPFIAGLVMCMPQAEILEPDDIYLMSDNNRNSLENFDSYKSESNRGGGKNEISNMQRGHKPGSIHLELIYRFNNLLLGLSTFCQSRISLN